jgi:hypothetical protein
LSLLIIILQIKTPFITNTTNELQNRINSYIFNKNNTTNEKNKVLEEIAKIEEDSLIKINKLQGGIDDINADTKDGKLMRPQLVLQANIAEQKHMFETFENLDNYKMKLKLLYQPGCPYSEEFLGLWTQIKDSLPSNVDSEEINCSRKDILGFSLCHQYKVSKVPTIILEKPDVLKPDETIQVIYRGSRDLLSIKQWLMTLDIHLKYNPEVEHFDRTGGHVSVEKFNELKSGMSVGEFGGVVLSAEGNLRAPYDKMYRDASKMNEFGEFDDVDDDGCPIAYFSKCKENSVNPGYQIFTHRGQWGCVYPDKNTSLNTSFDAAFSTVDHYLQSLPPKVEQVIDKDGTVSLREVPYTADERMQQMKKCAIKYNKEIRNFGLCNNDKLNDKYVAKERVEKGELNVPFDEMTADDYTGAMETAEAVYSACSV